MIEINGTPRYEREWLSPDAGNHSKKHLYNLLVLWKITLDHDKKSKHL